MAEDRESELKQLVQCKGLVYADSGKGIFQLWERFPQETVQASGRLLVGDATLDEVLEVARNYSKPA